MTPTIADPIFAAWMLPDLRVVVYCRNCCAYHFHGRVRETMPFVTHRVAPCSAQSYYLFVYGLAPECIIRDAQRRRSRWWSSDALCRAFLDVYEARDRWLGRRLIAE
jgi:hypothetical protein